MSRKRRAIWGVLFQGLTGLAAFIVVAMVAVILTHLVMNGWRSVTWSFLAEAPREANTEGGIYPAIVGTFMLVLLMTVAGVPLGVLTAIYLQVYARPGSRFVHWVRLAVQNLAGVPAIVYGLFGLGFFVQFCGGSIDRFFRGGDLLYGQPAILWAALTLAVMTLPTVIVATEEALRTVPQSYREGAYSVGATRWQMVWHVLMPQSVGGILTGTILAISRGAGEVAPILFTGAAYSLPDLPRRLTDQFMELGYHVYVLATQSPDVDATEPILYATVLVLLGLTFALNFTAILIRSRIRKRLRGLRG